MKKAKLPIDSIGNKCYYNSHKQIYLVGIQKEVCCMATLLELLLRSNFRCGRMLNSRALDLAGWVGIPPWKYLRF